jgi:hypothetical protein
MLMKPARPCQTLLDLSRASDRAAVHRAHAPSARAAWPASRGRLAPAPAPPPAARQRKSIKRSNKIHFIDFQVCSSILAPLFMAGRGRVFMVRLAGEQRAAQAAGGRAALRPIAAASSVAGRAPSPLEEAQRAASDAPKRAFCVSPAAARLAAKINRGRPARGRSWSSPPPSSVIFSRSPGPIAPLGRAYG